MNPEFWGISALAWQALSTVVAGGAFLVALVVGYFQLRSARKTRIEQSRPYVVVDLVPGLAAAKLADLVITNIGTTPAYDLTITFDPPPERAREDAPQFKLKDVRMFNEPTPMVAPGREFRMFFDSAPERYESTLPMSFAVTTRYRDSQRRWYDETVQLDFDVRRGAMFTDVKTIHDGVKILEKIAKNLQH
ncbi:hypothetical protein QRX50_20735 [Amycolatopsis carbonis]|uniref:Uncharacterized protein n=1 Tax=Amycolatopsis carbonis TaxID=715471 RepID=A0A9Y2IND5_9PSEU|nr:hypothetical protein [Amycolatopsis sp. 2-15]WIX83012.1 hypothetical protein QRX50_20735 [Amycolatopsis sp. 2-15]